MAKSARSDYMREYRQKNLERIKKACRSYYWAHRDKMLAYGKAYYQKKKAEMTEEDLEERRAYQRLMYKINKENRIKNYGRKKGPQSEQ